MLKRHKHQNQTPESLPSAVFWIKKNSQALETFFTDQTEFDFSVSDSTLRKGMGMLYVVLGKSVKAALKTTAM